MIHLYFGLNSAGKTYHTQNNVCIFDERSEELF
jgi:hypothetical protein